MKRVMRGRAQFTMLVSCRRVSLPTLSRRAFRRAASTRSPTAEWEKHWPFLGDKVAATW